MATRMIIVFESDEDAEAVHALIEEWEGDGYAQEPFSVQLSPDWSE